MLRGKRVLIRPIVKSDIIMLNKWKNDSEVFKYLGGGFCPVSIDQQINWIDSMIVIDGKNKRFIISVDEESIGMIGLYEINNINQNCEIGMYIGEKDYQGKGLGKEAYLLLEGYAKNFLNIKKIKLKVVSDNLSAVKFWESLGFEIVGKLKKERYIEAKFCDLLIMEKFI